MSDTDFLFSRRFGGIARLYGDDALQRFRKVVDFFAHADVAHGYRPADAD